MIQSQCVTSLYVPLIIFFASHLITQILFVPSPQNIQRTNLGSDRIPFVKKKRVHIIFYIVENTQGDCVGACFT